MFKKNKSPLPVILVVIAIAVLGGVAYYTISEKDDTPVVASETTAETDTLVETESEAVVTDSTDANDGDDTAAQVSDEPATEEDPVVATVYETEIKRSDVLKFIGKLPAQMRSVPIQNLFPLALDQVVTDTLMAKKLDEADLSNDPEVVSLTAVAKEQIERNVYVDRQVEKELTDKRLKSAYDDFKKQFKGVEEVKAQHILVNEEQAAKDIIKKLDDGGDFTALAKENSVGPSAERGGDLGYFKKGEMVPAFSDVAFALKSGEYTKDPVQTQFGWHVIKVSDRRSVEAPDFEAVKPQLEQQVRKEIAEDLLKDWRKKADIQLYDINGDKVEK